MSSIISEINNEEDNSLTPQEIADSKIKIILSKSISNEETFLHFSYVKLYIAYEPNSEFIFTNVEGIICLVANRVMSSLNILIFDLYDFKKQFEIELYTNVENGMTKIKENFLCIEYPTFFLGLLFMNEQSANEMRNVIIVNSTILNGKNEQFAYDDGTIKRKTRKTIKIEKIENLVTLHVEDNSGEITYDLSRGVNKFLEGAEISVSDLNYEFEIIRDRIKMRREKEENAIEEEQNKKENYKEDNNVEDIINVMNMLGKEENEEKDEIEMIRNENKLKKKNYMIKNENKLLKVISVDIDNADLIEEGNESGSDSDGSKGSKKSKMSKVSKMSKKQLTLKKKKVSNKNLPEIIKDNENN